MEHHRVARMKSSCSCPAGNLVQHWPVYIPMRSPMPRFQCAAWRRNVGPTTLYNTAGYAQMAIRTCCVLEKVSPRADMVLMRHLRIEPQMSLSHPRRSATPAPPSTPHPDTRNSHNLRSATTRSPDLTKPFAKWHVCPLLLQASARVGLTPDQQGWPLPIRLCRLASVPDRCEKRL